MNPCNKAKEVSHGCRFAHHLLLLLLCHSQLRQPGKDLSNRPSSLTKVVDLCVLLLTISALNSAIVLSFSSIFGSRSH